VDERARQSLDAINRLLDRTTPWLSEIGSWIFGGLVAVSLVGISSLLTVGPVDAAVRLSITLFACALPMSVAGIIVLRLTRDLIAFGVDDLALQAFKESGFPDVDAHFPPASQRPAQLKRRAGLALRYALAIAAISAGLVLVVFAHAEVAEAAKSAEAADDENVSATSAASARSATQNE
jgi:hypothetical protein